MGLSGGERAAVHPPSRFTVGRAERAKGATGEREVAAVFRAHGFDADRTPNSGGLRIAGDIYGNVPCHVETKRCETWRLPLWIAQAERECDGRPWVVAFRANRTPWYAALPLGAYAALLDIATREGG